MSKKDRTNLSVFKKKINFARIWLISVNKGPRLRTRQVFKTVVRNKEHEFIGQKQKGDFVKFSGLLRKTQTLKTFKIFETLSSSPMPLSTDLLSINMLAKASKYLSRYCKEFESDRNLEENKTPSSFSDIYVPKF